MVQRVHYRTRNPYNTRSNKTKLVKTPGGRLTVQRRTKRAGVPRCGDTGVPLNGIPALRPHKYSLLSKSKKRVNRAYGGSQSGAAVRDRILRSFLLDEQKIVKKVLKSKASEKTGENPAAAEKTAAAASVEKSRKGKK